MDREFRAMLPHRIILRRFLGEDEWGNNTYGVDEVIPALIEDDASALAPPATQSRQPSSMVATTNTLLTDSIGIKVNDKIVKGVTEFTVTNVTTGHDETGPVYQTITISTGAAA